MAKKKKEKIRYNRGTWCQARRCMNCNSLPVLRKLAEEGKRKKFEDSGMMIDEEGKVVECDLLCQKGWFHSSGRITS